MLAPLRRLIDSPVQFILAITAVRILWHLLAPVGMAGDESYYWMWGQHWDWGYYSKPPFIGWFFGLIDHVPLPKTWFFKSCAALFSAGSLYYLYRTFVVTTDNRKMAQYGLLAIALSPANLLFSSILTIDSPLMFFWAGAMYFTAKLTFKSAKTPDFLALLVFLALGHMTKQMMMFQIVIIILCALTLNRNLLKKPLFWLTLILSFASLIPPILWNANNQWITFQHTGHHFESASPALTKSLSRLGELLATLLFLVSPILFIQLFPAISSSIKRLIPNLKSDKATSFFFLYGGLGLLVMLGLIFRQRVNANWPAVYLLGGLGITLIWAFRTPLRTQWFKRGLYLAGTLSLILMTLLPLLEPLAGPLAEKGIKPQRRGWQGYPTLVSQTYDLLPADVTQIAFSGHRFTASQFAYHGKIIATSETPLKSVHLWNGSSHIRNQFDFFPSPHVGEQIAIIVEQKKASSSDQIPKALQECLSEVTEVGSFPIHFAREYPKYKIYLAKEVVKWPISPAKLSH